MKAHTGIWKKLGWLKGVKMNWQELKEEAKKMGAIIYQDEICFEYDGGDLYISYWKDGRVEVDLTRIAEHRTPEQMLSIMKALQ